MSTKGHTSRWHAPDGKEKINWETVADIPFAEYEKGTRDISQLDSWIDHALKFKIDENDRHFAEPRFSVSLARLYRLVLSKCDYEANELFTQNTDQIAATDKIREQLGVAEERVQRLLDEKALATQAIASLEEAQEQLRDDRGKIAVQLQSMSQEVRNKDRDIEKALHDQEGLRKELNRITRERDDLRRASESRDADATRSDADRNKIFDENQFIIKRFKETSDKLAQLTESYAVLQKENNELAEASGSEISSLRNQLSGLQQENIDLIQARNRAEDLCERREAQALQDMSELQQAYKEIAGDEQRRYQTLKEEYMQLRDEFELNQRNRTHIREVEERDDTIAQLKNEIRQLRSSNRAMADSNDDDSTTSSFAVTPSTSFATGAADMALVNKVLAERQKLEHENDALQGDLASLEIKCEQQDTQILKLQKRLTEYERGDEGLRRLRQELADGNRTTEQLQDETQQLRERLAHMEDVASLCMSLKLLCKRVGVTQEEIDRLQGSTNSRFGELDILRQETSSLKEEIEWLEKERRYWMNKVRLQPLLDTRLRFELGLTSEQLKQLDHIVDQMKTGSTVVEDTEGAYREKYLHEVEERQRDIQEFNDKMKNRIEEVLTAVMSSALGTSNMQDNGSASVQSFVQAVEEMRRHASETAMAAAGAAISSSVGGRSNVGEGFAPAFQPTKQMESLKNKLDEVERLNNDLMAESSKLREKIAGLDASLQTVTEERDAYRAIVFDAATGNPTASPSSTPSVSAYPSAQSMHQQATRRLGMGGEMVPLLKEQLKLKELRLQQISKEYDAMSATMESERARYDGSRMECEALEARVKTLAEQSKSLTGTLQMTSERISELEKVNEELQRAVQVGDLAPTSKEMLQKIVLLRQREAKLLQRLRISSQERDEATEAQTKSKLFIESSLVEFKKVMSGATSGVVLPPSTAQHASETEALRVLQQQLAALTDGPLFVEDRIYVQQLRDSLDRMDESSDAAILRTELRSLKQSADERTAAAEEKIVDLEATISRLRSTGATEPNTGTLGALEVEASTWRQKCAMYSKRLADRDSDLSQLEDQLAASRQQVVECKQEISALQNLLPSHGESHSSGGSESSPNMSPQQVLRYEKEIARLKSLNIGLLQTSLDLQCDKKQLDIQLSSCKRHLQLIKDTQGGGNAQVVSDFVVAALKDNSNLQQQYEHAQHHLKKAKLQLLTTESNFRVVANEAGAYKLSAHRLFKSYAEQLVKLVDSMRHLRRNDASVISARRAEELTRRVISAQKLADHEHERYMTEKLRVVELHSHIDILKDELDLLTAKSESPARAHEIEKSKTIELRSQIRSLQRQSQQTAEEKDYLAARLQRTEATLCDAEREVTRLECSGHGVIGDVTDVFLEKLHDLRDTVFAKSESPPIAVTMVAGGSSQSLGIGESDKAIRDFKDSLDRQAELSKRCAQLQQQCTELKQQTNVAESKRTALSEEILHVQQQLAASVQQLETERGRAAEREKRLTTAHQNQLEVMQRAVDHNTQCLRDLLAGKERTIQQTQQQLQTERQRYLEHQLLDTTRMERLHEQLFRENNAMMERFKVSMDVVGQPSSSSGEPHPGQNGAAAMTEAAHHQLQTLTQEMMQLRIQVKDLRTRNIMLESQLNDQIAAAQRQSSDALSRRPPSQQGNLVEHSLGSVCRDQGVALENLRRREHDLLVELKRSQEEVKQLHTEIFDLRNTLIDQVDAVSRGHAMMASSNPQAVPSSVANELRLQLTEVQNQLQEAKAQLSYERAHVKHSTTQSDAFKKSMQQMEIDLAQGTLHIEQARQILGSNQQLRADLDSMKDQSDRLQNAMSMLKQTLVQQTQTAGEREQKLQQEVAIAQRMTVLQNQSAENIINLQGRIGSMQAELQNRVAREEELLRKGKSAQLFAEEQHRLLLTREKELLDVKRELQHLRAKSPPSKTKQATTWRDAGVQVIGAELQLSVLAPAPLSDSSQQAQVGPTSVLQTAPSGTVPPEPQTGGTNPPAPSVVEAQSSSAPGPASGSSVAAAPNAQARGKAVQSKSKPAPVGALSHHGEEDNVHIAGVVSRQVLQMQKEKQSEIEQLRQQLRKAEAELEDASKRLAKEKSLFESRLQTANASIDALKSKAAQLEQQHRLEILKYLEERHVSEGAPKQRKQKRQSTIIMKEQSIQTESPQQGQQSGLPQAHNIPSVLGATPAPAPAPNSGAAATQPNPSSSPTPAVSVPANKAPDPATKPPSALASSSSTPQPTAPTPASPTPKEPVSAMRAGTTSAVGCQTDGGPSVAHGGFEMKGQQTKKWVELHHATSDLKVQEIIRQLRKDNAKMMKQLSDAQDGQKETEALREEVKKKTLELEQMSKKTTGVANTPASPLEIRSHKRELLRLEEYVDQLRRDINVKKEVELRELMLSNDRLTKDIRRVEAENATLKGAAGGGSASVAAGGADGQQQPAAVDVESAKIRDLETKLLTQEGLLLDLRFERETLSMKVSRLERHMNDILAVDAAQGSKPSATPGGANVGRKKEGSATSGKDAAALEGVIENMKLVVERLQSENMSLKANSVSSAQFMETAREVKHLRQRERALLEKVHEQHCRIEELQAAVLPGSKMSEQNAVMQRRLRMAQAAAEQFQLELFELRTRLGAQQRQEEIQYSTTGGHGGNGGTSVDSLPRAAAAPTQVSANASPHAAELHHLLPHHRH